MVLFTENSRVYGFALLAIVWTLLYFYVRQTYTYWERKGFKVLPGVSYIFGHFQSSFLRREYFGQLFENFYKSTREPFIGFYGIMQPLLLVRDTELIQSIMIKDFSHFTDRFAHSNKDHDPFSVNLITFPGEKWTQFRRKISPAFTSSKLKSVFSSFIDRAPILHKYLDDLADKGELLDINEVFERHATNTSANIYFGIDVDTLNNPNIDFRKYTKKALNPTGFAAFKLVLSFLAPNVMRLLGCKVFGTAYENFFKSLAKAALENDGNNNAPRKNFLQILLQLGNDANIQQYNDDIKKGDESENAMTMEEILVHANLAFGASIESPSLSLTLLMFEITRNPEIQDRLINEIDKVLKEHDGKITYDSIAEMKYVQAVIDELLRKYPFAPMLTRICVKDYKIPGTDKIIKKGDTLLFPLYGLHRDEKFYPDPERFDPERFNKENLIGKNQINRPYCPFGDGPRNCIGINLANILIKVGLVLLLQKFKFELEESLKSQQSVELDPKSLLPFPINRVKLHIFKR